MMTMKPKTRRLLIAMVACMPAGALLGYLLDLGPYGMLGLAFVAGVLVGPVLGRAVDEENAP